MMPEELFCDLVCSRAISAPTALNWPWVRFTTNFPSCTYMGIAQPPTLGSVRRVTECQKKPWLVKMQISLPRMLHKCLGHFLTIYAYLRGIGCTVEGSWLNWTQEVLYGLELKFPITFFVTSNQVFKAPHQVNKGIPIEECFTAAPVSLGKFIKGFS